jgi:hypothetical protein
VRFYGLRFYYLFIYILFPGADGIKWGTVDTVATLSGLVSEVRFHGQHREQGDHIGRFFACWSIVYFGQRLENYRRSAQFWATLSHRANGVLMVY